MYVLALLAGLVAVVPLWVLRWASAWRLAVVYLLVVGLGWRFTGLVVWGPGYDHGWIISLSIFIAALGFAARTVWHIWKRPPLGSVPPWVDPAIIAGFAVLAGINAVVSLSWHMAGGAMLAAHGVLGLAALLPLIVTFLSPHRLLTMASLAFAASLIVLLIYSAFVHPGRVLSSADRIAQGDDFCISLPIRQRAAQSWTDLTFLTMDKSPAWSSSPHAAVVTSEGPIGYWSFYRASFKPLDVRTPITYCDPLGTSGLVEEPSPKVAFVTLDEDRFLVPQSYRPLASGGNHLAVALDPMTGAPAPDGIPTAWIAVGEAQSVDHLATLDRPVRPGPHGLETLDLSGDPFPNTTRVYLARNEGGQVSTQIECWDVMCLHRFSPNGVDRIIFNHDPGDLPRWRDMQDRVAALFGGWRR